MHIEAIFEALRSERRFQDQRWGEEFDKKNTPSDWVACIAAYLGNAVTMPFDRETFQKNIFTVAALAVAILERDTYAPRHYDSERTDGLRSPDHPPLNGPCVADRGTGC